MKKKFTVTETRAAVATWIYEVEAESQEDALEKVLHDPESYVTDYMVDPVGDEDDSDFEVEETQETE